MIQKHHSISRRCRRRFSYSFFFYAWGAIRHQGRIRQFCFFLVVPEETRVRSRKFFFVFPLRQTSNNRHRIRIFFFPPLSCSLLVSSWSKRQHQTSFVLLGFVLAPGVGGGGEGRGAWGWGKCLCRRARVSAHTAIEGYGNRNSFRAGHNQPGFFAVLTQNRP